MRDYQKDLEVLNKMMYVADNSDDPGIASIAIAEWVNDVLPWYIKQCTELEAQLQQAEEREAVVKKAFGKWSNAANFCGDELDSLIHAIDALSSPSQPSRYQEGDK